MTFIEFLPLQNKVPFHFKKLPPVKLHQWFLSIFCQCRLTVLELYPLDVDKIICKNQAKSSLNNLHCVFNVAIWTNNYQTVHNSLKVLSATFLWNNTFFEFVWWNKIFWLFVVLRARVIPECLDNPNINSLREVTSCQNGLSD